MKASEVVRFDSLPIGAALTLKVGKTLLRKVSATTCNRIGSAPIVAPVIFTGDEFCVERQELSMTERELTERIYRQGESHP